MIIEQLRDGDDIERSTTSDSLKNVFDYFAGQLFDQTDPMMQDLLLRISFLPKMTLASTAALTGSTRAARLLEDHYRRHLFTDRRGTKEPVYQFHALFRAFLQERAQLVFDANELCRLARAAARLLDEQGLSEEAFQLYLRGGDQSGACKTIVREAERMIAQGRWRSVEESINALSDTFVQSNCWLQYWLGMAQASMAPAHARPVLIASHELAVRDSDVFCQVQAAAGVIQSYMLEYSAFRPMDPWIETLKAALTRVDSFPDAKAELRVRSALLIALSFRKPDDPALSENADRVYELVQGEVDSNIRTLGAAYLVAYGCRTGPLTYARKAAPLLQRLVADPSLSTLTVGWVWWVLGFFHLVDGDENKCRKALAEADVIGREEPLSAVSRYAAVVGAHVDMDAGNLDAAQKWSDRLEQVMIPGLAYDRAISSTIKAFLAVLRNDPVTASALTEDAVDLFDEAGVHHLRCLTRSQRAWALLMSGELAEAGKVAEEALQLARRAQAEWVEFDARAVLASIALADSKLAQCDEQLRHVFGLAQSTTYLQTFRKYRTLAAKLCTRALSIGIPVDNVRNAVRLCKLPAPSLSIEKWPWEVRIYLLGRFGVMIEDELLTFSRKTPKKPMALLKALIAFGRHDVAMTRLVDAIWPDEEGDSGHDACWLSLH
ncbi:MAG TPA: hypothetical protein VMW70_17360, partial [Burkholderiales bacterium]|nr:hypothetical protein [Burkholderiales bacterium]